MKVVILGAGYATRLRPLTDTWAKELLPVGGRPLIDWILDSVDELSEVDEVHVVTNARKAPAFRAWAAARGGGIVVHDDGTTSNEDRLGAIGDMRFVVDAAGLDDDLLVIAGDNLFDFHLRDFVGFWRGKGEASAIAVRDVGSLELAKLYSIVELDPDDRVVDFVEKPEDPATSLVAIATYLYPRAHVPLLGRYLDEGNPPDQPGRFVQWLHTREAVYAWTFDDAWYDIGNADQLLEADNRMRRLHGLPERPVYSPD